MNILFKVDHLGERGTMVAQYDYANYNEVLLGNKSFIVTNKNENHPARSKFESRFDVNYLEYDDFNLGQIADFCQKNKIDAVHHMTPGGGNKVMIPGVTNLIHFVFNCNNLFGDKIATVSEYISDKYSDGKVPFVPHVVSLPDLDSDMRAELGIPDDALVIGRHGGYTEFNVEFVYDVIDVLLESRDDIWFVLLNTEPFRKKHNRIIHLPVINELDAKRKFVNTCDIMLHARHAGETFGLAVGEFSYCNKPVLSFEGGKDMAHVSNLDGNILLYDSAYSLLDMINNLDMYLEMYDNSWDSYKSKFSPELVMNKFKEVFLS